MIRKHFSLLYSCYRYYCLRAPEPEELALGTAGEAEEEAAAAAAEKGDAAPDDTARLERLKVECT